jgi:Flp pilus assembly pilin Flp
MKRPLLRRFVTDRRGSSSVEFLLGVLFVAILMIGFLEMGRAIHYYQTLSDGARSGGRYLTREENPCDEAAIQAALGLAITRSSDWSRPPIFTDWPVQASFPDTLGSNAYGYEFTFNGAEHFAVELQGCSEGVMAEENLDGKIILIVKYQYQDYIGLLAFLGLQDGFWIVGRHEEQHIGA